jgi:hypothetical protein
MELGGCRSRKLAPAGPASARESHHTQAGLTVAIPAELGESKFCTVAPLGAVGVLWAALVTVDTPCETSGFDVEVVP